MDSTSTALAPFILVLDDDESDIVIISKVLHTAYPDATVLSAQKASQAMSILETMPIDCLIIDYNMPGTNGLILGRTLHETYPYLPIVLVTDIGDEMLAVEAIRNGLSDYIPKSHINTSSLKRTISRAIQISEQDRTIAEQKAELDTFAHALAHDFKQPMRQIVTFAGMLRQQLADDIGEDSLSHLDFLRAAADRLSNLVEVMSEYTLLGNAPTLQPVDMNAVLFQTRAALSLYISERKAVIECADLPIVVGNETLMRQVMQNLIANGIKYNESHAPLIRIDAAVSGNKCVISVHDNGIGIESQFLAEIFKPLKRLHSDAEYKGSGLGLTLARKALIAQNGGIWCESKLGEGTTFHIQLPLANQAGATAA